MNLLAIPTSNSKKSINKALLTYAATLLEANRTQIIDINEYEMPIYNIDLEEANGIPQAAHDIRNKIGEAEGLLISLAEHNGSYTAVFKNMLDWMSRIDRSIFQNKKIVLMSTSPGPGGASSVLEFATHSMPFFDGNVVASVSVPSFYENFSYETNQITNTEIKNKIQAALKRLTR